MWNICIIGIKTSINFGMTKKDYYYYLYCNILSEFSSSLEILKKIVFSLFSISFYFSIDKTWYCWCKLVLLKLRSNKFSNINRSKIDCQLGNLESFNSALLTFLAEEFMELIEIKLNLLVHSVFWIHHRLLILYSSSMIYACYSEIWKTSFVDDLAYFETKTKLNKK